MEEQAPSAGVFRILWEHTPEAGPEKSQRWTTVPSPSLSGTFGPNCNLGTSAAGGPVALTVIFEIKDKESPGSQGGQEEGRGPEKEGSREGLGT